jgi:hypothetical protein
MANLSKEARCVLGSVFGFGAVVTYHMQEYVPSPEIQVALDELVAAGMISREQGLDDMPAHGEAVRYRVAEGVDLMPYRQEQFELLTEGTAPSIRIFVKRDLDGQGQA